VGLSTVGAGRPGEPDSDKQPSASFDNGIRPQGIITAYWKTVSTIVPSGCESV
jgi:hypothetical protein